MTERELEQEAGLSEISIGPDGRVFVFGASRAVLEALASLHPADAELIGLLAYLRTLENANASQQPSRATGPARLPPAGR